MEVKLDGGGGGGGGGGVELFWLFYQYQITICRGVVLVEELFNFAQWKIAFLSVGIF